MTFVVGKKYTFFRMLDKSVVVCKYADKDVAFFMHEKGSNGHFHLPQKEDSWKLYPEYKEPVVHTRRVVWYSDEFGGLCTYNTRDTEQYIREGWDPEFKLLKIEEVSYTEE